MKSRIRNIIVFDLETGGVNPSLEIKDLSFNQNRNSWQNERLKFLKTIPEKGRNSPEMYPIVEIACCPISNQLEDLKEYDSGVIANYDPENRIYTDGALAVNGITRDQIKNGRDPKEVFDEFCKYLNKMKDGSVKPIVAGHNIINFDIPFLSDLFKFYNKNLEDYINLSYSIDTQWESYKMWPESVNYKLPTCCEMAGIELVNAHRAVADTRANKELVKFFIRNMRNVNSGEVKEEKRFRTTFQI